MKKHPAFKKIGLPRLLIVGCGDVGMRLLPLVRELTLLGGEYGIGRSDMIEDRLFALKSRELYETMIAEVSAYVERFKAERESVGDEMMEVTKKDVEEIISSWTDIPVTSIEADEAAKLINMEEILMRRIVGQDKAIKAISRGPMPPGKKTMRKPTAQASA